MSHQMIKPVSRDRIPFPNLAKNPQTWADDFLKMETAEAEYKKLKAEYDEIRKCPRSKTDQIKLLKQAYSNHCDNISKQLAGLLSMHGPDAFMRLPHMPASPINSFIPIEIFEAALDQLPPDPPDAMTDETKQKKLDAIRKKMDEQKAKIKKYSPQAFFLLKNGSIMCDSRKEFVQYWREKQNCIAGACNIQGIDITECGEAEKWAYKKLGIAKFISPKSQKLPFRP